MNCVNGLIKRHIFNYADCTPHLPDYDPNSVRNLIICSPNQIIQLLSNIHDTEEVNIEYTGDTLKIGSFYGRLDSIQGIYNIIMILFYSSKCITRISLIQHF